MEDQPLRSENVSSINAERKLALPLVACYCDSFPSARRHGAAVWSVTPVIIDVALDQSVSTVLLIRAKNYERCPDVGVARRLAASSGRKLAFLMFAQNAAPMVIVGTAGLGCFVMLIMDAIWSNRCV